MRFCVLGYWTYLFGFLGMCCILFGNCVVTVR